MIDYEKAFAQEVSEDVSNIIIETYVRLLQELGSDTIIEKDHEWFVGQVREYVNESEAPDDHIKAAFEILVAPEIIRRRGPSLNLKLNK